jgi:hypothetical protein
VLFAAIAAVLLADAQPAPDEILRRATLAWQARVIEPYEAFLLPCEHSSLSAECNPGDDAQFVVRMADGRTFARSVPHDGTAPKVLMRGGYIFGPGGAPLGFYRRLGPVLSEPTPPPNLAPDPLGLKTIASVSAPGSAYRVTLAGIETVAGLRCYHLRLVPLADPNRFPLRDLWVETTAFQVAALTYDWDFGDGHRGRIYYRFAPYGPQGAWAIEHIDADVEVVHELFKTQMKHVGDDLRDITFPAAWPAADFVPP